MCTVMHARRTQCRHACCGCWHGIKFTFGEIERWTALWPWGSLPRSERPSELPPSPMVMCRMPQGVDGVIVDRVAALVAVHVACGAHAHIVTCSKLGAGGA